MEEGKGPSVPLVASFRSNRIVEAIKLDGDIGVIGIVLALYDLEGFGGVFGRFWGSLASDAIDCCCHVKRGWGKEGWCYQNKGISGISEDVVVVEGCIR